MIKPIIGMIYRLFFPEDKDNPKYLKGVHPGLVTSHNDDDTSNVVGCTSKYKYWEGDILIETDPDMTNPTYARVSQGERVFDNSEFIEEWNDGTECINLDEIIDRL